jgi:hypothetical protein
MNALRWQNKKRNRKKEDKVDCPHITRCIFTFLQFFSLHDLPGRASDELLMQLRLATNPQNEAAGMNIQFA